MEEMNPYRRVSGVVWLAVVAVVLCDWPGLAPRSALGAAGDQDKQSDHGPLVTVVAEMPGGSVEEVEQSITGPIERSLLGTPGVRSVRSASSAGRSVVWVEFGPQTEFYQARQAVAQRLGKAVKALPAGVTPELTAPLVVPGTVLLIGLDAKGRSPAELRGLADHLMRPRLLTLPGVSRVIVTGGAVERLDVAVSPERLRLHGLGLSDVVSALEKAAAVKRPAGGAEDLADVVVAQRNGAPVRMRDLAEVRMDRVRWRPEDERLRGRVLGGTPGPAVVLAVSAVPGSDLKATGRKIDEALKQLKSDLPAGARLDRKFPLPPARPDVQAQLPGVGPRQMDLLRLPSAVAEVVERLRKDLPPGLYVRPEAGGDPGTVLVVTPRPGPSLAVLGPDLDELCRAAERLQVGLGKVPGVTDLRTFGGDRHPEVQTRLDRRKLARYGLTAADVARAVQAATAGRVVGRVEDRATKARRDVLLTWGKPSRRGPGDLAQVAIALPSGKSVTLSQVADLVLAAAPDVLYHDGARRAVILCWQQPAGGPDKVAAGVRSAIARVEKSIRELTGNYSLQLAR